MHETGKGTKKPGLIVSVQVPILHGAEAPMLVMFFSLSSFSTKSDYSATLAESQQTESAHTESQQTESLQQAVESTVQESAVVSAFCVLPPHDAKDTATTAANINTNFFIFFLH